MSFLHQYHTEPQIIHNQKINFEPHIHSEVEIISVFRGSAVLTANGTSYRANEGDFIILFPNIIHSYSLEKDIDVGKFIFNTADMTDFGTIFEKKQPVSPLISHEKIKNTSLIPLAKEILAEYKNSSATVKKAYLVLLTGKLTELCDFTEPQSSVGIIPDVLEYCLKNFRSDITLKDVANALYVSESCVSHIFCNKLKINFRSYINLLRINEAATLLSENDKSITDIAAQSGFGSIRSFNRAFLRFKGLSPKEYKKNLNYYASASQSE